MQRPHHLTKKAALLLALCLAALLALGGWLWARFGPGRTAARTDLPPAPLALVLDDAWADWFTRPHTPEEQTAYLTETARTAQALGADLLLLTGRAGGGSLFPTRDAALPTLDTVAAGGRRFDPVALLADAAGQLGIHTALIGTGANGQPLAPEALDQLAPAVAKYARRHHYKVMAVTPPAEGQLLTRYTVQNAVLLRADGSPGLLAAQAMQTPGTGAVLGSYTALSADDGDAVLYRTFAGDLADCWQNGVAPLLTKPVPQTLGFAYPAPGAQLYTDQVFVMGTSDPAQPLTLNGQPVERQGSRGIWGVLLDVPAQGQTVLTAAQGDTTATLTYARGESTWKPREPQSDGSVPAKWGQKLRITSPLASVLEAPADPDSIRMTAYRGAVAEVAQSLPLTLGSKNTFAYQLQNGAFVLAKDCELIDAPDAAFTGVQVQALENGDELLRFEGTGTPLYDHTWEDGVLTLRFYSAGFTGTWPASSSFVTAFEPGEVHTGFAVSLHFAPEEPLWGYHVDYVDGSTQVYLKRAPRLSDAPTGPLTGTTVLLDPGHGADDHGAMGSAGPEAPEEKDVNLALALAARHRLEQLGATVLLTREDDHFDTLGQRVEQLNQTKPDFFISVHHNSAPLDQDLNHRGGVEAYWFYTEGKPLADHLVQALGEATGRRQRGSFYNYFYVTRSNICPAVLLEAGFMTVPREYESVTDEAALWAAGGAIAQAIVQTMPG